MQNVFGGNLFTTLESYLEDLRCIEKMHSKLKYIKPSCDQMSLKER